VTEILDKENSETRISIEAYLDAMADNALCSDKSRLLAQMRFLYGEIDFKGKTVLDIGGGSGVHSFYAASCGAKDVLCLEPEDSGSSSGVIKLFRDLSQILGYENVTIEALFFQEFKCEPGEFDIVILHNSINHLDEQACIDLLHDPNAKSAYREMLAKLFGLCAKEADLIICDCSRHNFFDRLGIRNPFDPNIEWHKHQSPETWMDLLLAVGFTNPVTRWSAPGSLGKLGAALFSNKIMSYFFTSHFCLNMRKTPS
jgi:SAM-dependent methyltransferase